jgi:type IV pilus assembly protein PilQ
MKQIKQYLLGLVAGVLLALGRRMHRKQAEFDRVDERRPARLGVERQAHLQGTLAALPAAFSVAKPARMAFDFPNTTNGLGKSSQAYNEGDLKSANIVQAEDRTRVVLNLQQGP